MVSTPSVENAIQDGTMELSHFAQRHLDAIRHDFESQSMNDGVDGEVGDAVSANALSEFTYFPRLPQELHDHIFKLHTLSDPRIIYVHPRRDGKHTFHTPSLILNINRKIKQHSLTEYGFIQQEICNSQIPYTTPTTYQYTFHPDMDMLYLGYSRSYLCDFKVLRDLSTRLRSLALKMHPCGMIHRTIWEVLGKLERLELLFLVYPRSCLKNQADVSVSFYAGSERKGFRSMGSAYAKAKRRVARDWNRQGRTSRPVPKIQFVRELSSRS